MPVEEPSTHQKRAFHQQPKHAAVVTVQNLIRFGWRDTAVADIAPGVQGYAGVPAEDAYDVVNYSS